MNKNSEISQMYQELKQYFNDNIELLKKNAKGNVDHLSLDFQHEMDNFYKFCIFPELAAKVIVGVGGAFSAGKSSFLNSVLGRKILSVEIDPTTSIPTYLMYGDCQRIKAILKDRKSVV